MIDDPGPIPVDIEPSELVSEITFFFDLDVDISAPLPLMPRFTTYPNLITWLNKPNKSSTFCVIAEQRLKFFLGKSHDAALFNSRVNAR